MQSTNANFIVFLTKMMNVKELPPVHNVTSETRIFRNDLSFKIIPESRYSRISHELQISTIFR